MRIGARLVQAGAITEAQLDAGLRMQAQYGGRLASNLIELRYVELDVVARVLGQQLGFPAALQKHFDLVERTVTARLPGKTAQKLEAIPLGYSTKQTNTLIVAFADPRNLPAIDEVSFIVGARVQPSVTSEARVRECLDRFYGIRAKSRHFVRMDTPAATAADPGVLTLAESQASMTRGHTLSLPPEPAPRGQPSPPKRALPSNEGLVVSIPEPAVEVERASAVMPPTHGVAAPQPPRKPSHPRLPTLELEPPVPQPPSPPPPPSVRPRPVSHPSLELEPPPLPMSAIVEELPEAAEEALDAHDDGAASDELEWAEPAQPLAVSLPPPSHREAPKSAHPPSSARRTISRAPPPPPPDDRPAMGAADSIATLQIASTREEIGDAVSDFLRSCFGAGLVLITRNDVAIGWKGFAIDVPQEVVESIAVPLSSPSVLSQANDARALFRGAPPSDGAQVHARFFQTLRCAQPREVVVAPIVLNDRVVNLVYAHAYGGGVLAAAAIADLTSVCSAAAAAYVRLIQMTRERAAARRE